MHPLRLTSLATAVALCACGGGQEQAVDDTARDLQMAPAESVAAMADTPAAAPAPRRTQQPPSRPQPTPPRTVTLTVPEGTAIALVMTSDTITSRHNQKGEAIQAVNIDAVIDANGRVVIPPQAIFHGTISDLAPAESPGGEGTLVVTFSRVQIGDQVFGIQARTDSVGAHMKGRGVTVGDAAKVGAGAVVGGIAGRIIGGNKTGTIVGAAAGAAAGAGIAAATRDIDIILPQGAPVRIVLTAPFSVEVATN